MVEGVVPIGSGSDSPGPLTVKLAPPAGHEERRGHAGGAIAARIFGAPALSAPASKLSATAPRGAQRVWNLTD
jgi:hypothetical protein